MKRQLLVWALVICALGLASVHSQEQLNTREAVESALNSCMNCSGFEEELRLSPGDLVNLLREIREPNFLADADVRFSELAKELLDLAESTSSSVIAREAVETTLEVTRAGQRRNPQMEYVPFTTYDAQWYGPCNGWSVGPFGLLSSGDFALAVDVISPIDDARYEGAAASDWIGYGTCLMTFFDRFPDAASEYAGALLERDNPWLISSVAHELGIWVHTNVFGEQSDDPKFGAALQSIVRNRPEFFEYRLNHWDDTSSKLIVMDVLARRVFETEKFRGLRENPLRDAFSAGIGRVAIASAGKRFSNEYWPVDDFFWITADTVPYMGQAFAESPDLSGYCPTYQSDALTVSPYFNLEELRRRLSELSEDEVADRAQEWETYFKGLATRLLAADEVALQSHIRCADFLMTLAPFAKGASLDFEILAADPVFRESLADAARDGGIDDDQLERFMGFVDTIAAF